MGMAGTAGMRAELDEAMTCGGSALALALLLLKVSTPLDSVVGGLKPDAIVATLLV